MVFLGTTICLRRSAASYEHSQYRHRKNAFQCFHRYEFRTKLIKDMDYLSVYRYSLMNNWFVNNCILNVTQTGLVRNGCLHPLFLYCVKKLSPYRGTAHGSEQGVAEASSLSSSAFQDLQKRPTPQFIHSQSGSQHLFF